MKKLILYPMLLFAFAIYAQEQYFTAYNFIVEPHNVGTVHNLVDEFYKANKPEGVTVLLFENHFNDSGNNFTHSLVFAGSFDAIGAQYTSGPNESFSLFLTKLNQHIKDGFSSAMGNSVASFGADPNEDYPVRRMYALDVEDPAAFAAAFKELNSNHNPVGRLILLGQINSGHSPDGENHFVVAGFKDFKAAMGGISKLVAESDKAAMEAAWKEFLDTNGGAKIIRSSTRVLMGKW